VLERAEPVLVSWIGEGAQDGTRLPPTLATSLKGNNYERRLRYLDGNKRR